MRFLLFLGALLATNLGFAQEKRIPKSDAPNSIKQYISGHYSGFIKDKYYKEVEGNRTFIECEFVFQGKEYSLKFQGDSLIEVELSVDWQEVPTQSQMAINQFLNSKFGVYRILEIQQINPQGNLKYEITIKIKGGNELELLFDKNGNHIADIPIQTAPIPSIF